MKLLCCFVIMCMAVSVRAAVIVQDPLAYSSSSGDYLSFEAENYDTVSDTTKWTVYSDTNASEGKSLLSASKANPRGVATYNLRFTIAGDYYFYARMRAALVAPYNVHTFKLNWDYLNRTDTVGLTINSFVDNNKYNWYPGLSEQNWFHVVISQADLARDIPMSIEVRDQGMTVDRIVLSNLTSPVGGTVLNTLTNSPIVVPEPGMLTLLGLLAAAGLMRRGRRGE